ncbi:MAG: hypothetical protein COS84_02520 [Armatimonadetes bacterium CG07_land_8_20_14_0_80_40_9]|nr:MAG: hypothetical protein COS84_02520 [Armatimonadetes bacterium CG07_land_8_20_14_0_80_40_9]
MGKLKEELSYLKGLKEGTGLSDDSKEGKLFSSLISFLEGMTTTLENLENNYQELQKYIESVDKDLGELEKKAYSEKGASRWEEIKGEKAVG